MDAPWIPPWTGDEAALRALQATLAGRVRVRDALPAVLRRVAGFAAGVEDDGATVCSAAVLLDAGTLQPVESHVVRLPARMPDVPGLQSFGQLPAMLDALSRLSARPDLCLVDGEGVAHPRRFGLACHFGIAADLPAIGVATDVLAGKTVTALHDMRGAFTTLREDGRQIGWLLRSQPGCPPLAVSPGHRVAMASAPELVMRFVTTHRLPEPTRLAAGLARRGEG